MSGPQAVLLVAVVVIQLVCAIGVLTVDDAFDRLHLVGPVSVLGSVLVVIAVIAGAPPATHAAKVVVTGALLWAVSPFLSRATARALRIRAAGRLEVNRGEMADEEPS